MRQRFIYRKISPLLIILLCIFKLVKRLPTASRVLFAQKLRLVRRDRGLSQTTLAERTGIATQSHISHLEANRSEPSIALLIELANVLATSTDYFVLDALPLKPIPFVEVITSTPGVALSIGERIRALRRAAGLTQIELAERLDINAQGYISMVEGNTKELSLNIALRMIDVFAISLDALLRPHILISSSD